MATFLTTPRMSPALRERVERAVSHRTRAKHHAAKVGLEGPFANGDRLRAARVLPLVALLLVVGLGSAAYAYGNRVLEEERASLLAAIEERRAALPAGHEGFLARVDPWIQEAASGKGPEAEIDPQLREPGALDAWLGRPAVYVRAEAADLTDPRRREDAIFGSDKDAFLACLMSPPASTSERDLLAAVRGVYFAGGKVDEETAHVRRLAGARLGLPVLGPAFEARVRAAEAPIELKKLRKDLQSAPAAEAARAAGAELLIVVADETSAGARAARVSLVDLRSGTALLRARLRVPPAGSSALVALHRAEMEGCGLALSVRRSLEE